MNDRPPRRAPSKGFVREMAPRARADDDVDIMFSAATCARPTSAHAHHCCRQRDKQVFLMIDKRFVFFFSVPFSLVRQHRRNKWVSGTIVEIRCASRYPCARLSTCGSTDNYYSRQFCLRAIGFRRPQDRIARSRSPVARVSRRKSSAKRHFYNR